MDATEKLRRVRELFDELIDLSENERTHVLNSLTGEDAGLRHQIEVLLSRPDAEFATFESPIASIFRGGAGDAQSLVGKRLGPYTLVRLVGLGGMGAVFEATRADNEYEKRVAIKVVQQEVSSAITLARFRRERQILASLEHPNIATMLDGGVTDNGRPYLVMEFVDGELITTWCNKRSLGINARLTLFRQVCAAVQNAHRNLIIHRDLKPGNILVTESGVVKLLDFGIATLVAAESEALQPLTRGGARAFTPEYASPEQIRGASLSTASDVYSLGVVLFELLAGRRPHVVTSHALVDIERAVLESPAPLASSVVDDATARERSEKTAARLRHRLQGELDNVIATALQPDISERYASVDALDADVHRYLDGLPVHAQKGRIAYRARKFVQRNAAMVSVSALVVVALIGGTVATAIQARKARAEQYKAQQVSEFMRQLLASVHPETGRRDAQVSEVLDAAAKRIDRELASQPDVRAELETVIGQSYQGLGRYDEAELHLKRALALREEYSGAQSRQSVAAISSLGQLYMSRGALDSADQQFHRALTLQQQRGETSDSLYASLLSNLGSLSHNQNHAPQAEEYHKQALAIQRRVLGENSDLVALSINDIGVAEGEQGRLAVAESLHRVSLATLRRNNPQADARIAAALNALAGSLDFQGKVAAADSAYLETLTLRKQLLGADHPDYALTLYNYSGFIFDQKRYAEAAALAREILALRGKTLPESHPSVAAALQTLGRSLDKLGDAPGAEVALTESLALRQKYLTPGSWLIANSEGTLGEHFMLLKQYERAEQLMLHAQRLFVASLGEKNSRTVINTRRLVALYGAWGKPVKVAEYSAMIPATK
ncbi:MAG: serine/threonine-protein kinase [Gemmatimonadaceae bacterium]